MNLFDGKIALITGSSQGIGNALARTLAEKGAKIVLNGRNPDTLHHSLADLRKDGMEVIAVQGDVSNASECRKMVEKTLAHFGKIDILVNNAGITCARSKLEEFNDTVPKKIMAVNYLGSVYMAQACLPYLKKSQGSLVFISSLAGLQGFPCAAPYCASKMALTALAESLRVELADTGVHVGIVYVGFTLNDPRKKMLNQAGTYVLLKAVSGVSVMPVEKVANRIIRILEKRRFKEVLSPIGNLLYTLKSISPDLVNWILKRKYRNPKYHFADSGKVPGSG